MLTALAMALCAVAAFFVTACRVIRFRRLIGMGAPLDIAFTLGIAALFYGTLTGLLIATLSGLFMALTISFCRALFGYERPHITRYGLRLLIVWTPHPPRVSLHRKKAPTQ